MAARSLEEWIDDLEEKLNLDTRMSSSILQWALYVNEANFAEFPVLTFAHGVVAAPGPFEGFTEPTSFNEWISLYYYVVLHHLDSCKDLAATFLKSQANNALERMRNSSVTLCEIVQVVFGLSSGPEAVVWCRDYFRTAYGQTEPSKSLKSAPLRCFILIAKLISGNTAILGGRMDLIKMKLSVQRTLPNIVKAGMLDPNCKRARGSKVEDAWKGISHLDFEVVEEGALDTSKGSANEVEDRDV